MPDTAAAGGAPPPAPEAFAAVPLKRFHETVPEPSLADKLRALLLQLRPRLPRFTLLEWLPSYNRAKMASDALAACVVATVLVPQGMSYALLAGVDPVYGLYSSITPLFTYGLLTTSSSLASGPVAPSGILMNALVRDLTGAEDRTPAFTAAILQLAFASGIVLGGMCLLQLSWIADLLSFPVISGFTSGAACLIIASQLSDLFGIPVPREREFFKRLRAAGENAGRAHGASAAIGAVCLLVLLYAKDVRIRGWALPKLTPVPLLVMLATTALSYGLNWQAAGVRIIGTIPDELPKPSFPFGGPTPGADFVRVLPAAALLSIVSYVQTLSVGAMFAKKKGEKLVASREMLACALANTVGGCFQSIQVSGSFTRTAVQYGAGAATPAAGIMVGAVMIVAILTLTRVLRYLPMAVLAAVVVSSTRSLLEPTEALALWRGKFSDFLQLAVTFVAVLVLDVQNGLFTGIGFSLALVLYRSFQPRMEELVRLPGTDTFVARSRYPQGVRPRGLVVLRLDGEISFGNCRKLGETLRGVLAQHQQQQLVGAAGARPDAGPERAVAPAASPRAVPAAGSSGVQRPPHTRTRIVYALGGLLVDGRDALASLLGGGATGGSGGRRARGCSDDDDEQGAAEAEGAVDASSAGAIDEVGAPAARAGRRRLGASSGALPTVAGTTPLLRVVGGGEQPTSRSRLRATAANGGSSAAAAVDVDTDPPTHHDEEAESKCKREPAVGQTPRDGSAAGVGGSPAPPPLAAVAGQPEIDTAAASAAAAVPLRAVILDCSRVVDVDATGCRELREVLDAFDRAAVPLLLAALPGPVRDTMSAFGIDQLDSLHRAADAAEARRAARGGGGGGGCGGGSCVGGGGAVAVALPRDVAVVKTMGGAVDAVKDGAAPPLSAAPMAPAAGGGGRGDGGGSGGGAPSAAAGATRRAALRSLTTRYLSVSAAVAAVEAAYYEEEGPRDSEGV